MKNSLNSSKILKKCVQQGLGGIKNSDKAKLTASNTRAIMCSVDIDSCLKKQFPQENRWDYLVLTEGNVEGHFIEVHPAFTTEVTTVVNKKKWLKKEVIDKVFKSVDEQKYTFIWIATSGVHIAKNSPQAKKLATAGLKLRTNYKLD